MKHKNFDQIYPYVYYIKHVESGIKYIGVRYANVKQKRSPNKDFLKYYFTSIKSKEFSWFKDRLRTNLSEFEFRLVATFDDKNEAIAYEKRITDRVYKKEGWANQCSGKAICVSEEIMLQARKQAAKTYRENCKNGFKPKFSEYGLSRKREIANALNEKNKANPPRLGAVLSEEIKDKIRNSNTGKKFPEREGEGNPQFGRGPLYCIESPSGETVYIRGGALKFLKENNVSPRSLHRAKVCKGTVGTKNGWKVSYISD